MKLYLSSYRLPVPDELCNLVGKQSSQIKIALIPNAKDYYADKSRTIKIKAYATYFQNFNFATDIVDLHKLKNAVEVEAKLRKYDVVWACGGNTFCLRYEMKRSGFDRVIKKMLKNGLVFGGDSAGAIVAGPRISGIGIEAVDDPEYAESVIDEGLGLIPFTIIPHADSLEFADVTENIKQKTKKSETIVLNDSQAVIFDNLDYRVVTKAND